ncbi:MAG: hypothetical protein GF311_28225 [Candidatus Lokiarchaeota archaeon]|nr:hypothetical protein [Candidatus Lokiarchaeota archaeon]
MALELDEPFIDDHINYDFTISIGISGKIKDLISKALPNLEFPSNRLLTTKVMNVNIPTYTAGTYTYTWNGIPFEKANGKDTTEKKFSITYRVDYQFLLHKFFLNWIRFINEPRSLPFDTEISSNRAGNGLLTSRFSALRTIITIDLYGKRLIPEKLEDVEKTVSFTDVRNYFRQLTPQQTFVFRGAMPVDIEGGSYDVGSAEPTTRTVNFVYLQHKLDGGF